MLLPSEALLIAIRSEFARLQTELPGGEASAVQAIGVVLQLLLGREQGDVAQIRQQVEVLRRRLAETAAELPASSDLAASTDLRRSLAAVISQLDATQEADNLLAAERAWRNSVEALEAFAARVAAETTLDAASRTRLGLMLCTWERDDLSGPMKRSTHAQAASAVNSEITAQSLQAYLRDRFKDGSLEVTACRRLPGGFGKQTYLFECAGHDFSGSFVLRRDLAEPVIENDCHRIAREYRLVRAVHERGFPAPDAVLLDTEHALLPGGDFMIMRRSPGVAGGSVFTSKGQVPAELVQTLADILARLHGLPPLEELGELTDSIRVHQWDMPLRDCVHSYIDEFRALFEREPHFSSPALVTLFGWLLTHIPRMDGKPVLLHGDIGFHNFLFHEGRLSAVLDWEFGHLGDPAEDLAYACNTLGDALDWTSFHAAYRAAGGREIDARRVQFFRVWGHVRNACASNLIAAKFAAGRLEDLKLAVLPNVYIPQFLDAALRLIESPS
jgi:aminoglycoside phosphotransferase (APT) family kinase protein